MTHRPVPEDRGLVGRDPHGDGPVNFAVIGWLFMPLVVLTVLRPTTVKSRTSWYFMVGMAWGTTFTLFWVGLFAGSFWLFGVVGVASVAALSVGLYVVFAVTGWDQRLARLVG